MTRFREDLGAIYPAPRSELLADPGRFLAGGLLEVPWRTRLDGLDWLVYERGDRERFKRKPWAPTVREGLNARAMRDRGVWHYRAPSAKLLENFMGLAEPTTPQR